MATKGINAKSKRFDVRVPHDVAEAVETLKEDNESTGQFVVTALQGEIKRRQRKKAGNAPNLLI
ncbi:YlcI/YnfO family protein [Erwinia aphidicola]|uniref:YlcI/YnfO family protein n=1 Tax=Erwinia aphidicola TaxID=68334 RepID=UPI0030CD94BE